MRKFLLSFGLIFLLGCSGSTGAYDAIKAGGEWFLKNQDPSFLYYQYEPLTDTWPDSHHAVREFGSLWSITQLADFLQDPRYEDLAYKGWDYFKPYFMQDTKNNFTVVNISPPQVKLSYNAFAILVLLELEDPHKEALLEGLANGILYQQISTGELLTLFYSDSGTGKDYYPGQALLALMSLYESNGNETYLAAVKKALPHYEAYFEVHPNTAFVPWQTQAYYKYYEATGDADAAKFVFAMNDFMVQQFQKDDTCSEFNFSVGIVAGVYVEGMNKAYALADELDDAARKECYGAFIQAGSQAVMDLQFPLDGQNPDEFGEAAYGGFFGTESDLTMRVDRNQHAVMALMGAYELGLVK